MKGLPIKAQYMVDVLFDKVGDGSVPAHYKLFGNIKDAIYIYI